MDLDRLLAPTRALGAQWSVSVRGIGDASAVAEHEPALVLRTASVAKVFLLVELAFRLVHNEISAAHLLDRRDTVHVRDSGLWHAMRADDLQVADLALLVGAVSDNLATNALVDLCGLDRVQARARGLAPGGSMLHDQVRDERGADLPPTLSTGCARDWVTIMTRLHSHDGIDPAVCGLVLGWLAHGADLSMVAGAFDLDPLAHDVEDLGLRLWHKTGTDAGVRADIGLVRSAGSAVVYAVLCNWPPADDSRGVRAAVLETMREIGSEIRARL